MNPLQQAISKATFTLISSTGVEHEWHFKCFHQNQGAWHDNYIVEEFKINCTNPLYFVAAIDVRLLPTCFVNGVVVGSF